MPGLHYPLFLYLALVVARWRRSLVSLCMSCVLLTSSMLRGFHPLSSSRLCAFAPPRSVRFGSVRIGSVWFGSDRIGSFFIFEQARAEAAGEVLRSWKRCIGTLREQKKKKKNRRFPLFRPLACRFMTDAPSNRRKKGKPYETYYKAETPGTMSSSLKTRSVTRVE